MDSITELIVEIAEQSPEPDMIPDDAAPSTFPGKSGPRVLCLAATDRADYVAATMLSQLLERSGCSARPFPVLESPMDAVREFTASGTPTDVVCISTLPPFALLNARTLAKRLREQFPRLRIVVGLWNFSGSGKRAMERLGKAFPDPVVTTLNVLTSGTQAPLCRALGQPPDFAFAWLLHLPNMRNCGCGV